MSGQERSHHNDKQHSEDETSEPMPNTSEQNRDVEVDSLLDEIDDVLETNAESFVGGFVQKGGQ